MASVATPQTGSRGSMSLRQGLRALWDSYLFRRILKAIFTIWFVTTLLFFLVRLMPSNPLEIYVQELILYCPARSERK